MCKFCRKKAAPRNFHLAGRRRLPFIGVILAQIHLTHNTLWTLSPVLRKILHKRPGTSGQLCCGSPAPLPAGNKVPLQRVRSSGQIGRKRHFARSICQFYHHFQELHNFMFLSLCTLRIDKSFRNMYNKARNQRSTAEAQERANPADLKQKGARPMVDMEPAQQGQAVGIR